jgi:phosphatidylserine/phosphatidylglycerophosphate/cardiolipin synthase-like enzyme
MREELAEGEWILAAAETAISSALTIHNKVVFIDGRTVITGSFNFTKAAKENNAENLLVIRERGEGRKKKAKWI